MKILITGIDGYVGKSLCYGLNNYNITGINRKICDLTDGDKVRNFFSIFNCFITYFSIFFWVIIDAYRC